MEKQISIWTLAGLFVALSNAAPAAQVVQSQPGEYVTVKYYQIAPRPLNPENIKSLLATFKLRPMGKPQISGANTSWRDREGARLVYEPATSEFAFSKEMVPALTQKDVVPDSSIHIQSDILVKSVLKEKMESLVFANYEITMVQKRDPEHKDSVGPAVPAYYIGRYLKKVDGRIVLGDGMQIRVAYGSGGALQSFSFRDPALVETGSQQIPSKAMVADSLKRWEKSRTHTRTYTYPFHPDNLAIRSIKPMRIFESYVVTKEKLGSANSRDGEYLVPAVTVLAEVTVAASKNNRSTPPPDGPVLLHFHFPCRPASGLCWPDGNQDLLDQAPATR